MNDELKITQRHLPHWQLSGSYYFVTFRAISGDMSDKEKELVLKHILSGNDRFYELFAAVIMPDHVHIILRPLEDYGLSRIMQGIKGPTSYKINMMRRRTGPFWQTESFDRIIRDDNEFLEKANYIINNPIKSGLVENLSDFPFLYIKDINSIRKRY